MKKSVIILGVALMVFVSEARASHCRGTVQDQIEFSSDAGTPLHVAICKGDLESVKRIIEYGANVNKIVRDMSPLMLAARFNKVEIIKVLLSSGAKPNVENEKGFTALDYAKYCNSIEAIAILKELK
ncbi:ankyrin repeat domain-containing protein [Flavobacterium poyangense]|uniref:ankyrin repeat domain-containing protein n=1 Tax=Flavobacterium poyangense TaxID=2204302 RepID=UPI0014232D24|nr:ankyrin repeat domain-containing protein [Flavobacterium sp. JXAS1]